MFRIFSCISCNNPDNQRALVETSVSDPLVALPRLASYRRHVPLSPRLHLNYGGGMRLLIEAGVANYIRRSCAYPQLASACHRMCTPAASTLPPRATRSNPPHLSQ